MIKNRKGDKAIRVCDDCGDEREVSYWNIYKKETHKCNSCSNKLINLGRPSKFKGTTKEPKCVGNQYIHSDGYPQIWVGKDVWKCGYFAVHRLVVSDDRGALVSRTEKVHHINSDRGDYNLSNLYVCRDMSHHRLVHAQLERVAMQLVSSNLIKFDKSKGEYYLSPTLEELRVNASCELLETPNEKDEGNQQPSSEELKEMVQRLFRKEVQPK